MGLWARSRLRYSLSSWFHFRLMLFVGFPWFPIPLVLFPWTWGLGLLGGPFYWCCVCLRVATTSPASFRGRACVWTISRDVKLVRGATEDGGGPLANKDAPPILCTAGTALGAGVRSWGFQTCFKLLLPTYEKWNHVCIKTPSVS